jgi:drug/metabolite transporter (DMT)-like permease
MRGLSGNSVGIIMMIVSTASFTVNDTLLKLAMDGLPPFEALFWRGVGTLVLGVPLLMALGHARFLPRMLDARVGVRSLLELSAAMGFVFGLAHVAIADLTALGQTSPILLVIGAALFFREKLRGVQIALIAVAFLGAVLVAQPGASGFSPFTLLGLWSAASVAVRDLIGRQIKLDIPGLVIAVAPGGLVVIGAGIASLLFETWVMPSLGGILLAFGSAAFLIGGHWLLLNAYRVASVGAAAPFLYMSTVWALVSGVLVFSTVPNALALAGIALILVSGSLVVALERWPRRTVVSGGGAEV